MADYVNNLSPLKHGIEAVESMTQPYKKRFIPDVWLIGYSTYNHRNTRNYRKLVAYNAMQAIHRFETDPRYLGCAVTSVERIIDND